MAALCNVAGFSFRFMNVTSLFQGLGFRVERIVFRV
jgi:hypothetical protein